MSIIDSIMDIHSWYAKSYKIAPNLLIPNITPTPRLNVYSQNIC